MKCDTCKNREVDNGIVCCLYMGADCQNGEMYEAVTNADRIRAMSDEELAEFRAGGHCPPSRRFPDCATIEPCSKCWLEYLRQPVKDGEDE